MTKTTLHRTLVAAALLAAALPTFAQSRPPRAPAPAPSQSQATRLGGLFGLEMADGDTGLALRGDLQLPITRLGPQLAMDGVLSAGLSFFDEDVGPYDVSTTIFKLVPAARFTVPFTPNAGVYGDVGLGFYFGNTDVDDDGFRGDDDDGMGVTMRLAGGLFFDANEALRVGGELSVNPYFGDYDETTVALLFGVMFRL